tara:strand:- start:48 stop:971 length:924 start_codon:yes stop_codon:yes gene_type:complete
MKKRASNKKEVLKTKLKKTKTLAVNRRTKQNVPDPWKEIGKKLKPIGKAYNKFIEKRKVAKQKEELKKLKSEEEQRQKEEAALKIQKEEERIQKKKKKLKEQEEKKLRTLERQRLEEKRIKEEKEDQIRKEIIYKERLIKAEHERKKQLERVEKIRQEEKKLKDEMLSKIDRRNDNDKEQELKNEEERLKKEEQKLKEREKILKEREKNLEGIQNQNEDEKKLKDENRINGTVKWFNMSKGYGFIRREGEKKDIFVHLASVQHSGLKYLKEGEELTFEIEYNDKGPSAINLQKVVNEVSHSYLKVIK